MERIVIVGAGQGGMQAAMSLRQDGLTGNITLIGEEPGLPYQRPPLSKAYMADGIADRLILRPTSFFERSKIDYRDGVRVTQIDRERKSVTLSNGENITYAHLILATGAANWAPPIAGINAPGVFQLRTLEDATALRNKMASTKRAVVIGGGFIGLEFAAMARDAGVEVTVVEAGPRLMARAISPAMSRWFLDLHHSQGTKIILGTAASSVRVDDAGEANGVILSDGTVIDGSLVLVAAGVRPSVELAEQAGLSCNDGVIVDGRLLTSDPAISALGDCARFPLPDGGTVRLESVQAAVDHARHIARRLAKGEDAPYSALPWFWSDQGKIKLQIVGIGAGADRHEQTTTPAGEPVVLAFNNDTLIAVETVNAAGVHMAARRLIGTPYHVLAEHHFDVRKTLSAVTA